MITTKNNAESFMPKIVLLTPVTLNRDYPYKKTIFYRFKITFVLVSTAEVQLEIALGCCIDAKKYFSDVILQNNVSKVNVSS